MHKMLKGRYRCGVPLGLLLLCLCSCNSLVSELDRIRNKQNTAGAPAGSAPAEKLMITYPYGNRALFFQDWAYSFTPSPALTVAACTISPALPAGLTIAPATCTISGTPTASQPETSYTVEATDAGKTGTVTLTLTVIASSASRVYGQPDFISGSVNPTNNDSLASPFSLAVTDTGVYVADAAYHRVLFFPGASTIASQVYGQADFVTGSFPGTPNQASLKLPRGVAIDPNGNIWIADRANHRVVRYTAGASSADGLIGQSSYSVGTSGGCDAHSLNAPDAVAADANGVYVADTLNHRVLYFPTLNPGASLPMATRIYGQSSFSSCTANAGGIGAATLNTPGSIAITDTGVFIGDRLNSRVLFFAGTDTTATRVYGQPDFVSSTATAGQTGLNLPRGIAATEFGIFISDTGNNRILFFRDEATTASVVFGQNGSFATSGGNLGGIAANYLSSPAAVTLKNGLYIIDLNNNRLLYF